MPSLIGFAAKIGRDQWRPANDFIPFNGEIDLRTPLIAAYDSGLDAQRFLEQSRNVVAGGAGARAAAAGRLFGVAQVIDCLKWSVGPNIMQDVILFRRTDPGELCPVKLDFGAGDKLVEVERGIKSTKVSPSGLAMP